MQLGQQGHLHTKTVELEKVKRDRAALDIKSRFVFIYEEALVYEEALEAFSGSTVVLWEVSFTVIAYYDEGF